jgi:hypothetical protein
MQSPLKPSNHWDVRCGGVLVDSTTSKMPLSKIDNLKLYSNSLARHAYFKSHFSASHPTCEAEAQLLEMGEARLRLQILEELTVEEVEKTRPGLEEKIRQFVVMKLNDITDDAADITRLVNNLKSRDFDALFHFHS